MDLRADDDDRTFREEVRAFLEESLSGDFAVTRGRGGPGDEDALFDERLAWERHLGAHGWTCVGWPTEHGGRGLPLRRQVIYHEEYARARAPGRLGIVGEGLLGPTLIAFGTAEQQRRFLPPIVAGESLWCQGFSEPDAGSDLANLSTRAVREGDEWVVTGQKVWTSLAQWAEWCFVLARTDPAAPGHRGISFLLVPMHGPGVETRPIVQLTGDSEFNEVFFDGARTGVSNLVGEPNQGWQVAMGTLAFERGASTLGQQLAFRSEFDAIVEAARANGGTAAPVVRQRLARAHIELEVMRLNALRTLSGTEDGTLHRAAMVSKLHWAGTHQRLGELAMDVLGPAATAARPAAPPPGGCGDPGSTGPRYDPTPLQRLFLFSRADTIYGGSNQVQRNIIGERAFGLPKEPRPSMPGRGAAAARPRPGPPDDPPPGPGPTG